LQTNQSSDSGSVDCINLCQVEHDIPSHLLRSRAQKKGVITTHNPAQTAHNRHFIEVFDSYRQHISIS